MIIKRINIWFMCDFHSMRCLGPILIVRPKQACVFDVKTKLFIFFRFRREILYQLPPLERFLMTISSIWCHLWKSTHTRPVRFNVQSSVLESSFDTPTPWGGEHNVSTPVFHPTVVEHSQTYSSETSTLLDRNGFFWKKRCGIITKWMKP